MTRSKWDWQRVGEDLENTLIAVGTYPAYYLSRFVASVRLGWLLGQNRPEAASPAPIPDPEPEPREIPPEEPRSTYVPNPVDPEAAGGP